MITIFLLLNQQNSTILSSLFLCLPVSLLIILLTGFPSRKEKYAYPNFQKSLMDYLKKTYNFRLEGFSTQGEYMTHLKVSPYPGCTLEDTRKYIKERILEMKYKTKEDKRMLYIDTHTGDPIGTVTVHQEDLNKNFFTISVEEFEIVRNKKQQQKT